MDALFRPTIPRDSLVTYQLINRAMGYRGGYEAKVGIEVIEQLWLTNLYNKKIHFRE